MDQSSRHDETTGLTAYLASPVVKRSVLISGHATSVSLEKPFWDCLTRVCKERNISLNTLVSEIDEQRDNINLSSALRLYILYSLSQQAV